MAERKEPSQFIGDFLRELSVLLFAFYILDDMINGNFTWWGFFFVCVVCGAALWWGILLADGKDL